MIQISIVINNEKYNHSHNHSQLQAIIFITFHATILCGKYTRFVSILVTLCIFASKIKEL